MPFLFSYVCDLLQKLEDNRTKRSGVRTPAAIIQDWFQYHKGLLHRDDFDTAALLSTLLPEKRTDRVYNIREKKLQTLIGRGLILGRSRIAQLGRWTRPEAGMDLAECVEGILNETPNPVPVKEVTVEEIDGLLHGIAAACRFSSPSVRSSGMSSIGSTPAEQELGIGELYRRLPARDAKWLTRMILKNYEPVIIDPGTVYRSIHPLLPAILKVQDDITVAGAILDKQRRERTVTGRNELAQHLKPRLGVKIGRQTWIKGRSIKHCLGMVHGRISCEEKLDGEYCQIHIDLSKGKDCIQIFSKSGKDSTRDRFKLHDAIRDSLQIDQPACPIKKGCILEGELVVYSDKEHRILDFHKIRKHVSRSGTFIGTAQDSQAHPWEHLMIVYYDVLMIDDTSLLSVKHSDRFQKLKDLITVIPGHSALVKRVLIDCDRRTAKSDLRRAFAKCITAKGEGLVLKSDDPYFDFDSMRRPYRCCAIKLKKEYIGNFGDVGDFAVVGARYDAAKARTYDIPRLKWTHFYVGCLENKEEVERFGKKPRFVVTNVVELNKTQMATMVAYVNPECVSADENSAIDLRIELGIDEGRGPVFIFPTPPVVDLRCFSFDKEGNTGFWSPRFPVVTKVHCDRSFQDTISFQQLQELAEEARNMAAPEDSQEILTWVANLQGTEPSSQPTPTASQRSLVSRHTTTPPSPSTNVTPQVCRRISNGALTISTPLTSSVSSWAITLENRKRSVDTLESDFEQENKVPRLTRGQSAPGASTRPIPALASIAMPEPASVLVAAARSAPTASAPIRAPVLSRSVTVSSVSTGNTRCHTLPASCGLSSFSVLLSPCIANFPYVGDLLRSHGIYEPVIDANVWKDKRFASTKRLALVEPQRPEATEAFFNTIRSLDLKKRGLNEHEYIPIFDWRVLEKLKAEEARKGRETRERDERFAVVMMDKGRFGEIWQKFSQGFV
ncbi:hypothetical protein QBC41DRAFT_356198 [Cercophora samala]|uniref:ATP-dependent DNA ligase family profile domain-containing protein n=1 Tax=Cercophora samala TaxID=330535 RepID=A0AA39ZED6_9PEZI|nr:hypothetical protein QBC41DRAFT_356198 [Cercophora samala]